MLQRGTALAVILALSLVLAACGGSAEQETSEETSEAPAASQAAAAPQPEPTPVESASEEAASASGDTAELVEHLRAKSMQLWEVYNTYDLEALKAFYGESYWQEREEQTRLEMQPFQNRGLKITPEETSPPTEIAPGKWETKHKASFPGGSVNIVFIYEQFDGEWLLTHLEPG